MSWDQVGGIGDRDRDLDLERDLDLPLSYDIDRDRDGDRDRVRDLLRFLELRRLVVSRDITSSLLLFGFLSPCLPLSPSR